MRKNVFIIGLDDFYREEVEAVLHPEEYAFRGLLTADEVKISSDPDFDALLDKARDELNRFEGSVDGIVIHWDFPSTALKAILCQERNLPSASLEAVLKCGHKYWSRLEQQRHTPEVTPKFCKIDPYAERPREQVELDYPFWLKPVKAYSSKLGFHIHNESEFDEAIEKIRAKIHEFAVPFNDALAHATLPPEMENVGGSHCIAEEFVKGVNVAPEGHVFKGDVRVHGIVTMVQEPAKDSYGRCEYPSQVPQRVQERVSEVTKRLVAGLGYDNDCFNIEYLWNEETDYINIIEINPRISRVHSNLFHQVDGQSNHEIAVHVATGEDPHFRYGEGPHAIAADFWWRVYEDGIVTAVPSQEEMDRVQKKYPGTRIEFHAENGRRISDITASDSYSYVIADVSVGAENQEAMVARFNDIQDMLTFEYRPLEE